MPSPVVKLRMKPAEIERLDALAAERHTTRSAVLRSVLEATPSTEIPSEPPTWSWALERLREQAASGSTTAAAALARELRLGGTPPIGVKPGPMSLDDLDLDNLVQLRQ